MKLCCVNLTSLHKHLSLAGSSQTALLTLTWPAGAGYGETVKFVGGVNKPKLVQCQDSAGHTHQQVQLCCCSVAHSDTSFYKCQLYLIVSRQNKGKRLRA